MQFARYACSLMFVAMLMASNSSSAEQVSADDFLPPVKGGPTDVKQPSAVKVEKDKISAATPQDAINAAVQQNTKSLADAGANATPELGAKLVSSPGGIGVVASGIGTYRVMENATATRIAKRKAYVIAFTMAKKNMAEFLGGLSNEGKDTIRQAMANIETDKESKTNLSQQSEESLNQSVQMMLRGFTIYEVADDTKTNAVTVSIISSPKTRGAHAVIAPAALEVNDLKQGIDQVLSEVNSGVVPPVGGRVVIVRSTGETAFVGFGSAVVRENENAAVQARMNLEAQKIAKARAQDALCGLIIGDDNTWEGKNKEYMKDSVQEFEPAIFGDPLSEVNAASAEKLSKARQTFLATYQSTDAYQSIRKGMLPPGIVIKTWPSDDKGWFYGMAVYVPSVTNVAGQAAGEMRDAKLIQPVQGAGGVTVGGPTADPNSSGFKDEKNPNVPKPSKDVGAGPTGKVKDQE